MDEKQIQYILKVAECQNITRAAQQLYMSQPALSHFISKVEEELGAKLFNREPGALTLTEAGERYVKTARMILNLEESLKRDIERLNSGKEEAITLGLSDMRATVLLPFVLPGFKRLYPNVKVRTVESSSRQVEENVENGIVDMGIIPLYDYNRELDSLELYDEELVLVSASALHGRKGAARSWVPVEELQGKDFILLASGNRMRHKVDACFLEHSVSPSAVLESASNMTAYMLATTGMALSIVPDIMVNLMNPVRSPLIYSVGKAGLHWNIGAVWRRDQPLTGVQKEFLRMLKTRFQ